jgi:hypothetical protein
VRIGPLHHGLISDFRKMRSGFKMIDQCYHFITSQMVVHLMVADAKAVAKKSLADGWDVQEIKNKKTLLHKVFYF